MPSTSKRRPAPLARRPGIQRVAGRHEDPGRRAVSGRRAGGRAAQGERSSTVTATSRAMMTSASSSTTAPGFEWMSTSNRTSSSRDATARDWSWVPVCGWWPQSSGSEQPRDGRPHHRSPDSEPDPALQRSTGDEHTHTPAKSHDAAARGGVHPDPTFSNDVSTREPNAARPAPTGRKTGDFAGIFDDAGGGTRTPTACRPRGPKPRASTSSATPAIAARAAIAARTAARL